MNFQARTAGFTLVEIMIVVTIIGLLVGIATPNFLRTRVYAPQQICIENLSQIESAKQRWALESNRSETDTPASADLIGLLLFLRTMPLCPPTPSARLQVTPCNRPSPLPPVPVRRM